MNCESTGRFFSGGRYTINTYADEKGCSVESPQNSPPSFLAGGSVFTLDLEMRPEDQEEKHEIGDVLKDDAEL
jgi:hypothetical protein